MSHWRPSSFLRLQAFTDVLVRWLASLDVSSTHPRRARPRLLFCIAPPQKFQSTRPRAHAGRDLRRLPRLHRQHRFQSTRPRGARRRQQALSLRYRDVSIHAPTRGATFTSALAWRLAAVSIHAPTRGATMSADMTIAIPSGFNPRAHAGRDRSATAVSVATGCFNPRAHAGRDRWSISTASGFGWFQSTRPRGARPAANGQQETPTDVSIHAPTRGATS